MIRIWATWLTLLSATAWAQNEFEGLDLSGEQQPAEQKPADDENAAPGEGSLPETDSSPRVYTPPEDTTAVGDEPLYERDITQEDRVKSVQRKLYIKRGRFELAPYLGATINDPYYSKIAVAGRGAFYFADTLAVSARFTLMQVVPTDDVRIAKRNFQSKIFFSVPIWSAMGNVEWSPFYGKVAFYNSILHFDAYLIGGAGVVTSETSFANEVGSEPSQQLTRGPHFAADVGLGMRFVARDYLAVNLALINTSYVDQPTGTTKGATQNMMMAFVGVSLFIPFKSTYREDE